MQLRYCPRRIFYLWTPPSSVFLSRILALYILLQGRVKCWVFSAAPSSRLQTSWWPPAAGLRLRRSRRRRCWTASLRNTPPPFPYRSETTFSLPTLTTTNLLCGQGKNSLTPKSLQDLFLQLFNHRRSAVTKISCRKWLPVFFNSVKWHPPPDYTADLLIGRWRNNFSVSFRRREKKSKRGILLFSRKPNRITDQTDQIFTPLEPEIDKAAIFESHALDDVL